MKTSIILTVLFSATAYAIPAREVPPAQLARALSDRQYIPTFETDCDLLGDALPHLCDILQNYVTCTNGIITVFKCEGGCKITDIEVGYTVQRCDNAVAFYTGTYPYQG